MRGILFHAHSPLSDKQSCGSMSVVSSRMTTCLENLEMSGNLKHVRDFVNSQGNGNVRGKSCHGKVSQNCSLVVEYLCSYGYLVASS